MKQTIGGMKMYIEFLEGSPLWYWYNYGGVIAGMAVTVILAAMVIGLSSWRPGGIFLKTLAGASLATVMPLGLARIGFRMAISNPELVGYLSIGGTALVFIVGIAFFIARATHKENKPAVADAPQVKEEATQVVEVAKPANESPVSDMTIQVDNDKTVAVGSDTVTIGRGSDNDIVLDDSSVSRHHARITRRNGSYYVEDLDSTNGITIDGVPADGNQIKQGTVVKLGKVEIGVGSPMPKNNNPEEENAVEAEVSKSFEQTYLGKPQPNRVGWLTMNSGENAGDVFYLNAGANVLGRDSKNGIVINDSYVSGVHCEFKIENNEVTLFDLGSTSGTKVNEKVLTGRPLNPGNSVTIGDTELKVLKTDTPDQFESVVDIERTAVDIRGEKTVALVAVTGPDAGKSYSLREGVNILGRNSDAQICLSDRSVSRRHAMIKCIDGRLTVFDMGSSTGTKLDGVKLGGVGIKTGDVISIGRTELTFMAAA